MHYAFRSNTPSPPLPCSNLTDHQLVSLDFNVLDSLNTKLERPVSNTIHITQTGVKVLRGLLNGLNIHIHACT